MTSLIFGFTPEDLWPLANLCIVPWVLMMFAPRWRYTPMLTLVTPVLHAIIYTFGMASVMFQNNMPAEGNFMTFQGVATLFKERNIVFLGWIHYCFSDVLVGRWILGDALANGSSLQFHVLVMMPVLFLSCMLSPAGWLVYMFLVRPLLTGKGTTKIKKG